MPTLYVTEPGARIEKEYQRLLVTKQDEVLASVPLIHVNEVVLVGGVGATIPSMLALLDQGAGLTLISSTGKLRGRLRPAESPNLRLRQLQYEYAQNHGFCLEISRRFICGKISNSRTLALRMNRGWRSSHEKREDIEGALRRMDDCLRNLPGVSTMDELRGFEGLAAKAYFRILRKRLDRLPFQERTRRPPKDPVNALLSLAYSLLTGSAFTALEVAGLDQYAGFLQGEKYGRPSLALDLVEEFRSIIGDSVVLSVVNNRMVQASDFEPHGNGLRLKRPALRRFLRKFSARLQTNIYHPLAGHSLSYQRVLEVQARQIRKSLEIGEPLYSPFLVK